MEELRRRMFAREFSSKRSINLLSEVDGQKQLFRKRFKACYKINSMNVASKITKNKVRKVSTVCAD